jgi:hypothetical protein
VLLTVVDEDVFDKPLFQNEKRHRARAEKVRFDGGVAMMMSVKLSRGPAALQGAAMQALFHR